MIAVLAAFAAVCFRARAAVAGDKAPPLQFADLAMRCGCRHARGEAQAPGVELALFALGEKKLCKHVEARRRVKTLAEAILDGFADAGEGAACPHARVLVRQPRHLGFTLPPGLTVHGTLARFPQARAGRHRARRCGTAAAIRQRLGAVRPLAARPALGSAEANVRRLPLTERLRFDAAS